MRGRDVKHIPQALLAGLFGDKEEHALDEATWQAVMGLPLFEGLDADERMRLRELAIRLLADTDGAVVGGYSPNISSRRLTCCSRLTRQQNPLARL